MDRSIEELVRRVAEGDDQAFTDLYSMTSSRAFYLAKRLLGDDDQAEDVLQEAYVKALTNLDQLNDPSRFQGWLDTIVANMSKNYLRKQQPQLFSQMGPDDDSEGIQDIKDNAPTEPAQPEQPAPKPKREYDEKTKRLMAIGAGVAVVLIAVIAYFMFRTPSINLDKYVTVTFSGYDTVGTARSSFDREKFEEDNEKTLQKKAKSQVKNVVDLLYGSYSEAFMDEIVSGSLDKRSGLSNGDTVKVTVSANTSNFTDYCIENYRMVPISTEKEFTVTGLDYYVTSISEISTDAVEKMKAQAQDVYDANEAKRNDDTETYQGMTNIGSYLLTAKGTFCLIFGFPAYCQIDNLKGYMII